jgi:hypothetical protein
MAEERKKSRRIRVGARVGKADIATRSSGLETSLSGSKYQTGGSKMKAKKGGVIRKPSAKIRYSHSRKAD